MTMVLITMMLAMSMLLAMIVIRCHVNLVTTSKAKCAVGTASSARKL